MAAVDAMSLERFAEMLGWPKDFLGRYKRRRELENFRMIFVGYLKGLTTEPPRQDVADVSHALGAFLEFLLRRGPNAVGFLQWANSARVDALVERYRSG